MNNLQKVEELLLNYANVQEDLDLMAEFVCERDFTSDEIANILIGTSALLKIKFDRLWRAFEKLTEEYYN